MEMESEKRKRPVPYIRVKILPKKAQLGIGRLERIQTTRGDVIFMEPESIRYFDPADAIVPDRCDGNE